MCQCRLLHQYSTWYVQCTIIFIIVCGDDDDDDDDDVRADTVIAAECSVGATILSGPIKSQ
jgi:hypothetical protein